MISILSFPTSAFDKSRISSIVVNSAWAVSWIVSTEHEYRGTLAGVRWIVSKNNLLSVDLGLQTHTLHPKRFGP